MHRFPEDKHIEMDGEVEDEGKQKAEGTAQERPRERHSNRIPVVEAKFVGGRTKEEKAVAQKGRAAVTGKAGRKSTRSPASKIFPIVSAPHVPGKGWSSGDIKGFGML